jgi:hypothetical protein
VFSDKVHRRRSDQSNFNTKISKLSVENGTRALLDPSLTRAEQLFYLVTANRHAPHVGTTYQFIMICWRVPYEDKHLKR